MRVILELDYSHEAKFNRRIFNAYVERVIHDAFPDATPKQDRGRLVYLATSEVDEPQKLNFQVRA